MPLEVKKQDKENAQSLIRRFTRSIQRSGLLRESRKKRFHKRKVSDLAKKRSALRREQMREEYARLEKLGLLKDRVKGKHTKRG